MWINGMRMKVRLQTGFAVCQAVKSRKPTSCRALKGLPGMPPRPTHPVPATPLVWGCHTCGLAGGRALPKSLAQGKSREKAAQQHVPRQLWPLCLGPQWCKEQSCFYRHQFLEKSSSFPSSHANHFLWFGIFFFLVLFLSCPSQSLYVDTWTQGLTAYQLRPGSAQASGHK